MPRPTLPAIFIVLSLLGNLTTPARAVNLADLDAWDIVLPAEPIESETCAAEELQYFLAEATGCKLPIHREAKRCRPPHLRRPVQTHAGEHRRFRPPQRWATRICGSSSAAATSPSPAAAPRGTLYGVYTFLENYLGVRFLTPDHTHVPKVDEETVLDDVDYTYLSAAIVPLEQLRRDQSKPGVRGANAMQYHSEGRKIRRGDVAAIDQPFLRLAIAHVPLRQGAPGVLHAPWRKAAVERQGRFSPHRTVQEQSRGHQDRHRERPGRARRESEPVQHLGQPRTTIISIANAKSVRRSTRRHRATWVRTWHWSTPWPIQWRRSTPASTSERWPTSTRENRRWASGLAPTCRSNSAVLNAARSGRSTTPPASGTGSSARTSSAGARSATTSASGPTTRTSTTT